MGSLPLNPSQELKMAKLSKKQLEDAAKAAKAVSDFTLKVARPLFWHIGANRGGLPRGATAFILKFEGRSVAVTAEHVLREYLSTLEADKRVVCQLGEVAVHPEKSIIARSDCLDIATFEIEPNLVSKAGGIAVDCTGDGWPSPDVEEGDTISLTGFLDEQREKYGPRHYNMNAWGANGVAEAVTKTDILTVYERDRVHPVRSDVPLPPLGLNMSGCSGGPVFLIKMVRGLFRWFPVALIYKGPVGKPAEGELAGLDRIFTRRIHFLNPDGTINEPGDGWLPN
jgi:hypothetical protein